MTPITPHVSWLCAAALSPGPQTTDVTLKRGARWRSEEHTSELQSQSNLVCRLLLEKKKKKARSATRLRTRPRIRYGYQRHERLTCTPMLLISFVRVYWLVSC